MRAVEVRKPQTRNGASGQASRASGTRGAASRSRAARASAVKLSGSASATAIAFASPIAPDTKYGARRP